MADAEQVVTIEKHGKICVVTLNRPEKHNAMSEAVMAGLKDAFLNPDPEIRVIVLRGNGASFCAGLDLSEHRAREPFESVLFSRMGHAIFDSIQYGGCPVIAALHGAVIGGGLEMASCAHIRVADRSAYYQLPEGRRGIFIGGGGSVRISKLIGSSRMIEMMLTGRKFDAEAGERLGLSHYLVEDGTAFEKAMELAEIVAGNARIPNYLIVQATSRIEDMSAAEGLFTESLAQAISLTSDDAKAGIDAFLNRRKIDF